MLWLDYILRDGFHKGFDFGGGDGEVKETLDGGLMDKILNASRED